MSAARHRWERKNRRPTKQVPAPVLVRPFALLRGDPPVHVRFQHIQGQRPITEHRVVEGAQIKAFAELLSGRARAIR